MKAIEAIRADFPILSSTVGGKPLVYLDSAATAQKPVVVIETIDRLHRTLNANVHRGNYTMAIETTTAYETAREHIRHFIGAASPQEIIFTSGATESINLVAFSFGERHIQQGDNLILTEMEHHSNLVPWQLMAQRRGAEIRVLPFDDNGALRIDLLPALMDSHTRIVAITQTSNVLGTSPDLSAVIEMAHQQNIPVLVDGCQGIVHSGVDVQELGCDFYTFSGHKLYGPTGIGVLYGREKWLAEMPPYKGGGEMIASGTVRLPMGTQYAELPFKFEAGTPNYIGAIGLGAAINYLEAIEAEGKWIALHERKLLEYVTRHLNEEIAGLRIYGVTADKAPIVSFTVEGVHPMDIGMIADKLGIAIRTGTHCAEPIMAHYGLTTMCRLSIGLYNTIQDMDTAVEAIRRAVQMLK